MKILTLLKIGLSLADFIKDNKVNLAKVEGMSIDEIIKATKNWCLNDNNKNIYKFNALVLTK